MFSASVKLAYIQVRIPDGTKQGLLKENSSSGEARDPHPPQAPSSTVRARTGSWDSGKSGFSYTTIIESDRLVSGL